MKGLSQLFAIDARVDLPAAVSSDHEEGPVPEGATAQPPPPTRDSPDPEFERAFKQTLEDMLNASAGYPPEGPAEYFASDGPDNFTPTSPPHPNRETTPLPNQNPGHSFASPSPPTAPAPAPNPDMPTRRQLLEKAEALDRIMKFTTLRGRLFNVFPVPQSTLRNVTEAALGQLSQRAQYNRLSLVSALVQIHHASIANTFNPIALPPRSQPGSSHP